MKFSGRALGMAFIGLLLSGAKATADAPIRVAVPDITNLLTAHQDGIYQQILARALDGLGMEVEERFYPYKRAMLVFEKDQADCIYSFTEVLEDRLGDDAVIASFPLGKFSYYLFALKTSEPPENLDALAGKQVGAVAGHEAYLAPLLENHDIDVVWSKNDELNITMLEHKRFDTMVAAIPDVRPYLGRLNYTPELPLMESYDRLTCHNTERNRTFLTKLSREMRRLKDTGVYEQLGGSLYVDFDSESVGAR